VSELPPPDKRALRAAFSRAAEQYDAVAVIQREIADRLLDRLDYIRLQPQRILDLGSGTGYCTRALAERYPKAQLLSLDLAEPMLQHARAARPTLRRLKGRDGYLCGDAERLPLASASVDLIFSSLTLQWVGDLGATCAELRRVLRPGGLLLFTTLGPDTLHELAQSWAAADTELGHPSQHVNRFHELHQVGDALHGAGLTDVVMDRELLTLTYADPRQLMADLKTLGAHNVNPARPQGLTGPARLKRMLAAYEQFRRADGQLPASYEAIYAHAWAGETPVQCATANGGVGISLEGIRVMLRGRGGKG